MSRLQRAQTAVQLMKSLGCNSSKMFRNTSSGRSWQDTMFTCQFAQGAVPKRVQQIALFTGRLYGFRAKGCNMTRNRVSWKMKVTSDCLIVYSKSHQKSYELIFNHVAPWETIMQKSMDMWHRIALHDFAHPRVLSYSPSAHPQDIDRISLWECLCIVDTLFTPDRASYFPQEEYFVVHISRCHLRFSLTENRLSIACLTCGCLSVGPIIKRKKIWIIPAMPSLLFSVQFLEAHCKCQRALRRS